MILKGPCETLSVNNISEHGTPALLAAISRRGRDLYVLCRLAVDEANL